MRTLHVLGDPGDLVSSLSVELNGATPKYNPTYSRLTKSPGPPSSIMRTGQDFHTRLSGPYLWILLFRVGVCVCV